MGEKMKAERRRHPLASLDAVEMLSCPMLIESLQPPDVIVHSQLLKATAITKRRIGPPESGSIVQRNTDGIGHMPPGVLQGCQNLRLWIWTGMLEAMCHREGKCIHVSSIAIGKKQGGELGGRKVNGYNRAVLGFLGVARVRIGGE